MLFRSSTINVPRTMSKNVPKAAVRPELEPKTESKVTPEPEPDRGSGAGGKDEEEDVEDDDEKTIVLRKPPASLPAPAIIPPSPSLEPLPPQKKSTPTRPRTPPKVVEKENARLDVPTTPAQSSSSRAPVTPASERRNRPVITTEIERIVVRFVHLLFEGATLMVSNLT